MLHVCQETCLSLSGSPVWNLGDEHLICDIVDEHLICDTVDKSISYVIWLIKHLISDIVDKSISYVI